MPTINAPQMLSAQVVLGQPKLGAQELQMALGAAGFSMGPVYAGSFSITACPDLFERWFGVRLAQLRPGDQHSVAIEGQAGLELPLTSLAPELRKMVKIVLFTNTPDFGPGNP